MKQFYSRIHILAQRYTLATRLLLSMALVLLISTGLHAQPTATPPASGVGSLGDPYQIASLNNLYWIAADNTRWSSHYIQTANIDASATSVWSGGGWVTIGNSTTKFTGSYDGQGYTIDGLYISRTGLSGSAYLGLFGYIDGARIDNVGMTNVDISGRNYVGGLIGRSDNSFTFSCYSTGVVNGRTYVGGLVGWNDCIFNSYSTAEVNGWSHVGGLVGLNEGNICASYSTGTVSSNGGNEDKIGGFVGNNNGEITNSYSEGNVSGVEGIGGFVGDNSSGTVTNCYSMGAVEGEGGVGGFAGVNYNALDKVYSTGAVTAVSDYGGLVGYNEGSVDSSFWDTQTSLQASSDGGTGKTTAQMKTKSTFTDAVWDFTDIWAIVHNPGNSGYPYLQYQFAFVWTGGATTTWGNTGNWDVGEIPGAIAWVEIPGSLTNYPKVSNESRSVLKMDIKSGGELTIASDGRLTVEGILTNSAGASDLVIESGTGGTGSIIVNNGGVQATVQRYVIGNQWHIVSSPITDQGIQAFIGSSSITQSSTNANYAMTHYLEDKDTGAGGWGTYYTGSTGGNMTRGQGYLAGRTGNGNFVFSGELTHKKTNIAITRATNGWNAIGNPYPSAIGVRIAAASEENFLTENSTQLDGAHSALYIYDPADGGEYKVINGVITGFTNIDQSYIQPGQGFIVKSKTGGGTVSFTPEMRYHDSSSDFFKKSTETLWPLIQLKATANDRGVTTVIAFGREMTRGLDPGYDAGQYVTDQAFRIYSRLIEGDSEIDFAMQALPDYGFEDMEIPVGFDFIEGGEVTFSTEELRLPSGAYAILEDRALGIFTDLETEDYTVSVDADTKGPGRFFLHTDIQTTSVDDPFVTSDAGLNIYSYGKEIFIVGEVTGETYAGLYDLMGREIKTVRLQQADRNSFRVDGFEGGVYLLRVYGGINEKATRLFIE